VVAWQHQCQEPEGQERPANVNTKQGRAGKHKHKPKGGGGAVHGNQEAGKREGWRMQNNGSSCSSDNDERVWGYKQAQGKCRGGQTSVRHTNECRGYK
jgi:hypothetical protein